MKFAVPWWFKLQLLLIFARNSTITVICVMESSRNAGTSFQKADYSDKVCPIGIFPRTVEGLWTVVQPVLENFMNVYQIACPATQIILNETNTIAEFEFKSCINPAALELVDEWCTVNNFEQKNAVTVYEKLREGTLLAPRQLFSVYQNLVKPLCPFMIHSFGCLKSNYSTTIEHCNGEAAGNLVDSFEDSVYLICNTYIGKIIRSGQLPCISAGIKCIADNIGADQKHETKPEWCMATRNIQKCFGTVSTDGEEACRGNMNRSLEIISGFHSGFCGTDTDKDKSNNTSGKNFPGSATKQAPEILYLILVASVYTTAQA